MRLFPKRLPPTRSWRKRWAARSAILLASWFLCSGASAPSQKPDPKLAEFNRLSQKLVCQCGCSLVLHSCGMLNCESATPMRAIIRDEIDKGRTDDEILAKFVRQYGTVVLSSPPPRGFNLSAWIMPFLVFGAGTVVVYRAALRMKRKKDSLLEKTPAGSIMPSTYDSRIEEELQDFEEGE